MGLKGDPNKLRSFAQKLKALPITLAAEVATDAAPAMTELTQQAYSSGRSVYGEARPAGVNGQPLTLHKTGATQAGLHFIRIGTIVRCVLPNSYQRYLIRYGLLPNGGMPSAWRAKLDQIVHSKQGPAL